MLGGQELQFLPFSGFRRGVRVGVLKIRIHLEPNLPYETEIFLPLTPYQDQPIWALYQPSRMLAETTLRKEASVVRFVGEAFWIGSRRQFGSEKTLPSSKRFRPRTEHFSVSGSPNGVGCWVLRWELSEEMSAPILLLWLKAPCLASRLGVHFVGNFHPNLCLRMSSSKQTL